MVSTNSLSLGQKPIQLIGEGLTVRLAEGRRSARVHPAGTEGIEKIPHIQSLSDVFFGVELAARVQGMAALGNQFGGQGDIGGDDKVALLCLLDDVVVRSVESGPHLYGTDVAGYRHLEGLIGDQGQWHGHPIRGSVKNLLDHLGAGVGIDPNMHEAQCFFLTDQLRPAKFSYTNNPSAPVQIFLIEHSQLPSAPQRWWFRIVSHRTPLTAPRELPNGYLDYVPRKLLGNYEKGTACAEGG